MASTDAQRTASGDGRRDRSERTDPGPDRGQDAARATAGGSTPLVTFVVFARLHRLLDLAGLLRASNYFSEPYLSPFYSPCLSDDCVPGAADFGQPFGWWPLSPALLILIFPLGFRLTCYYYRKAYYRAFWLSPPACAVAEPHGKYTGETRFPLIVQNIHRWFWYAAVVVALILTYDVLLAFGPAEGESDGIHMGLGTLIMLVNVVLIWLYTLALPLVPAHHGRPAAALLQAPGPLQALDLGLEAQRPARALRVVLPVLGRAWTSTSTCSRPAPSTT